MPDVRSITMLNVLHPDVRFSRQLLGLIWAVGKSECAFELEEAFVFELTRQLETYDSQAPEILAPLVHATTADERRAGQTILRLLFSEGRYVLQQKFQTDDCQLAVKYRPRGLLKPSYVFTFQNVPRQVLEMLLHVRMNPSYQE